jgi:SAM-dependent methyltransferase
MTADTRQMPHPQPAWKTHLGDGIADGTVYESHFNPALLDSFAQAPRRLLDIGCAAGLLGREVRTRHPGCEVIGVEPHAATAAQAATRLTRVINKCLEDIDFDAEGIAPGSVDTLVAADVLEHMVDPWRAMLKLKPLLSADAQLIFSVPNVRFLPNLQRALDLGEWQYAERGILDVTHLRFFTLKSFTQLLAETGFRAEHVNYFIDPSMERFYADSVKQQPIRVGAGRLQLHGITPQELAELCTWQFFIRARALPG